MAERPGSMTPQQPAFPRQGAPTSKAFALDDKTGENSFCFHSKGSFLHLRNGRFIWEKWVLFVQGFYGRGKWQSVFRKNKKGEMDA